MRLLAVIFCASLFLFDAAVTSVGEFISIVLTFCCSIFLFRVRKAYALFLFGALIPSGAVISPHTLEVFATGAAASFLHKKTKAIFPLWAFAVATFPSALHTWITSYDGDLLASFVQSAGRFEALKFFYTQRTVRESFLLLAGLLVMAMLADTLAPFLRRLTLRTYLFSGLSLGVSIAAVVCLLQVAACWTLTQGYFSERLTEQFLICRFNRQQVFVEMRRFGGTFTDPNALGIAGALIIPLLFTRWREAARTKSRTLTMHWYLLTIVLLGLAMLWSGSRTALLLAASGLLLRPAAKLCRSQPYPVVILLTAALSSFVLLRVSPQLNTQLQQLIPLPTVVRALQTIDAQHTPAMFYSRSVYFEIARAMSREHPLIGVGLARFYDFQQLSAERIGIDLQGWRDNANNFYLQILAEQGTVGFAIFGITLLCLAGRIRAKRGNNEIEKTCKTLLSLFVIALAIGPHLHFAEVRAIIAVLILCSGVAVSRLSTGERYSIAAVGSLFILSLALIPFHKVETLTRGLYPLEYAEGIFAWTANNAHFSMCRDVSNLELTLFAPREDLPIEVTVQSFRNPQAVIDTQTVTFRDAKPQLISLDMGQPDGNYPKVQIKVEKLWKPKSDPRSLGVALLWPKDACRP